jgi:RHS repeat-associated protein
MLTDPAGGAFTIGYDAAGRQTSLTRPNGVNDTTAYDPAGNLTSLHSALGATLTNQADYTYNAAGLRSSLTTTAGTTNFTYDSASQLTSATQPLGSGMADEQYTYDPVGNRTSSASSPLGSFTYDGGDRLLEDATAAYQYDREGNVKTRVVKATGATTHYSWAADHQLLGITYPDNSTSTFRYDPLGRRVEVVDGPATSRYAFDGQAVAAEYDGTNALVATYVRDPNSTTRTFEMTRGGQRYFYLTDAQGSTTALTTISGAVANTYKYDAFGRSVQLGSVANAFTFTGQFVDRQAGLFLFPARAYDPALGRFLSEDPLAAVNPYPYVSNNPTNAVDPLGLSTVEEGVHQHHIIARTARLARAARDIALKCLKGNINDPRNLVGLSGSFHGGLHTVVYYAFINLLIGDAYASGGCVAVLGTLSLLGGGL